MWDRPSLYNKDLTQLVEKLREMSWVPELAVAAENWDSLRSWQLAE
jgi:hypothetical protein